MIGASGRADPGELVGNRLARERVGEISRGPEGEPARDPGEGGGQRLVAEGVDAVVGPASSTNALATLAAGGDTVRALLADRDPLVRAAALGALGELGDADADVPVIERALTEPAWQIRVGAARALSGVSAPLAVPTLSRALTDTHLDVRKAAVLSLTRWAGSEIAAREALGLALKDVDADVRAYARRALEPA